MAALSEMRFVVDDSSNSNDSSSGSDDSSGRSVASVPWTTVFPSCRRLRVACHAMSWLLQRVEEPPSQTRLVEMCNGIVPLCNVLKAVLLLPNDVDGVINGHVAAV